MAEPVLEARDLIVDGATDGGLAGVSLRLLPGTITCVLGDAAAGGRSLVEALAGLVRPRAGSVALRGVERTRWSPGRATRGGIGAALGNEGLLPGLPAWRSFVLGREPALGVFPLRLLRRRRARAALLVAMAGLGVADLDPDAPPERLSEEVRRLLVVARALQVGATATLLLEPTQGLAVEAVARVLDRVLAARERGVAVLLATGNVQHAWAVGDRFVLLYAGRALGTFEKPATSREELYRIMLGDQDFDELATELAGLGWQRADPPKAAPDALAPAADAEAPTPEVAPAAEPAVEGKAAAPS